MVCAYSWKESNVDLWTESNGAWHGAFSVDIPGSQVHYVKENPEVEKTFIKTNFYALRPENTSGRSYFAHIDLDKNYRNDMGWEEMAVSGRLPEQEDEIAVSEDFIKDNPTYKLGSHLLVDEGKRIFQGESVDVRAAKKEGESFEVTEGDKLYTIVGILDASYEFSQIPSYISMGYSNEIREDRMYIVNIKFHNVKKTYELMPLLSEKVGLKADILIDTILIY